ncbi:MAG: hypothetical protein NZO58_05100 [Gemmataceae bacterium]|nr:hypothetical protein [Gemmataceae bacterium]
MRRRLDKDVVPMKIRHPALIRTLGFTGACLLKAWLGTLRVRTDLGAGTQIPADRRRQPVVYCFWHENLLMGVK